MIIDSITVVDTDSNISTDIPVPGTMKDCLALREAMRLKEKLISSPVVFFRELFQNTPEMRQDILNYLLWLLPLAKVYETYHTYGIFRELPMQIFQHLCKKTILDMHVWNANTSKIAKSKCIMARYMINIAGQFNTRWNFTPEYIKARLQLLAEQFPMIDIDDYRIGISGILHLGCASGTPKYNMLHFYPKDTAIRVTGIETAVKNGDCIYIAANDIVLVIHMYDMHSKHLLQSGELGMYINPDKIYIMPEIYHALDTYKDDIIQGCAINIEHMPVQPLRVKKNGLVIVPRIELKKLPLIKHGIWVHAHPTTNQSVSKRQTWFVDFKRCYMCRKIYCPAYTIAEYPSICIECALFNIDRRKARADLKDFRVYVSGGRQKIGFETALKLLRCGAHVWVSTRFPQAAWFNYARAPDFEVWKNRLTVMQCDFVNMCQVQGLIKELRGLQLHCIINNACQTIRPTKNYIQQLHKLENFLCSHSTMIEAPVKEKVSHNTTDLIHIGDMCESLVTTSSSDTMIVQEPEWVNESAVLDISTCNVTLNNFHDVDDDTLTFETAWFKRLDEIPMAEVLEANIINQIVPTLIIQGVKPSMSKPTFIINVTAVEGQFDSKKHEGYHAHTNMCKAGLNMLSMTLAAETIKDQYVYAVDPGFVSGVYPGWDCSKYPITAADGAARVLDPIIRYYEGDALPRDWVKLKDYVKSPY